MYELIKESVNNQESALELAKSKKDVVEVVDAISDLSLEDATKLGYNFKKFPIGCDLTEVVVGTCASDLSEMELLGNCRLANSIGATIHICAYAFADIAEKFNKKGIDVMREVYDLVDVPLDLDHFGINGPMRFPQPIVRCGGECYNQGPPFTECPRERIHQRIDEKEKEGLDEKEDWVKLSSSVAVNLTSEQTGEGHAAPFEEALDLAKLAKKYGKGLESIMFVGDGHDELITGFEKALDIGTDVFVIESGPFNTTENPTESFAKAIAAARILCPGKVVATNGAYEYEVRAGLRAGLNVVITGFPKNHHGYMCGYEPGTARRGQFGLPKIMQIMNEELNKDNTACVPAQREELISLTTAVKLAGPENIYPKKIGSQVLGDAHWATVINSKLYQNIRPQSTIEDSINNLKGSKISLHGGRFLSWVIAEQLDKQVDEIVISDPDPWVEKVTVETLQEALNTTVLAGNGDDVKSSENVTDSIIATTVRPVCDIISKKIPNAHRFV